MRMQKEQALAQRAEAAASVAQSLATAEGDFDRAMGSLAALTTALLNARAMTGLSPVIGQSAFDRIGESTALMFQARSRIIDAHHCLNATRAEINLPATAFGPWQDCPPPSAAEGRTVLKIAA
ncbi:hypothetical protein [Sphingomonas sp. SUN039]|uniref:hypothetical protein n=1 Tax=Sphingomonas sp. SUN039 TaxID=2937787 RepID=UPI0021646429|nr:hypothetical protein [Sphingomonas sp. SUN039]UVO53049.1 hypothetical protein M0209_02540 [Sphingomonas sp. SUN039]